jgi:oligopeptide/dipeptide ABC transporter ATP-binding protein
MGRASGQVIFEGDNLLAKSDTEIRRLRGRKLAMILQDPMTSLNPSFSIGTQVGEALRIHRGLRGRSLVNAIVDILRRVRIPAAERRIYDYPHQMSGGMRQRIVGAIMFSMSPKLLIADEPTTSLDVTIQAQYLKLLSELQEEFGFAMIFISHDMGVVASLCDQIAVMYAGRIVEHGATEDVLSRPAHPYTVALLRSLPRLEAAQERLVSIPGQPPDSDAFPVGCRFAPRCSKAQDICNREYPETAMLLNGHQVNCFFPVHDE